MRFITAHLLIAAHALCCGQICVAQSDTQSAPSSDTRPATQPAATQQQGLSGPARIPWSTLDARQQEQIAQLLKDPNWPIRAFALTRLGRYSGQEPTAMIPGALHDADWQVRCFALRQALRMNIAIDPTALAEEMDPHVLRAALRFGVALPAEQLKPHITRLLKTHGIEELVLGLELAASTDMAEERAEAEKRAVRLIKNMDDAVALLTTRRLGLIFGLQRPPENARGWRAWLAEKDDKVTLADAASIRRACAKPAASPLAVEIDDETFTRLLDYLSSLKQRDLDLVIVMDATASMIPMVNSARAGIDALILFMRDISKTMRIAFVAYRDHDNAPVWDGHEFTTDIASIRKYLFNLRITGGADYPEAVLDGLTACTKLDWNKKAEREIVLVGDAPPHDEDVYQVHALLDGMRNAGITVHAVHVPMEYREGHYERLGPEQALAARKWLEDYNTSTARMFAEIAEAGGGDKTELKDAEQLVPSIMHFTVEEPWWPAFDEFYAAYLELCR